MHAKQCASPIKGILKQGASVNGQTDNIDALTNAISNPMQPDENQHSRKITFSEQVVQSIFYRNSGSGISSEPSCFDEDEMEKQKKLLSVYQHISKHAINLARQYLPDNRDYDSLAIPFFGAIILPANSELNAKPLEGLLSQIANKIDNLPIEYELESFAKIPDEDTTPLKDKTIYARIKNDIIEYQTQGAQGRIEGVIRATDLKKAIPRTDEELQLVLKDIMSVTLERGHTLPSALDLVDLADLFARINQKAVEYYPAQSFAARLFASTILVDAKSKVNLSRHRANAINLIISLIHFENAICPFKSLTGRVLKDFQSTVRSSKANQNIINPTLRDKILRLHSQGDYTIEPMSNLINNNPEDNKIYVEIKNGMLHYKIKGPSSTLENSLTAADFGKNHLPEALDFNKLEPSSYEISTAVIKKGDAIIDFKSVTFTDAEIVFIRLFLEKNGPTNITLPLNSALYELYKKFDAKLQDVENIMQHYCSSNTWVRIIFDDYLIKHSYAFLIVNHDRWAIGDKIGELWRCFLMQLQAILNALPIHSITLWRLGHFLITQADQLFLASSSREITDIFLIHNAELNRNGMKISQQFLTKIKDGISPVFLKTVKNQLRFKDREDLEQDLQIFRYKEYAEWASYLTGAVTGLLILLMVNNIIDPVIKTERTNYLCFSILVILPPILALLHRKLCRIEPQQQIEKTFTTLYQQNGPQLFATQNLSDESDIGAIHNRGYTLVSDAEV